MQKPLLAHKSYENREPDLAHRSYFTNPCSLSFLLHEKKQNKTLKEPYTMLAKGPIRTGTLMTAGGNRQWCAFPESSLAIFAEYFLKGYSL